jgi:pimeloyl-ACP methyl ester carboxylesterase
MGHSRERTGRIFIELMRRLGYDRYGVQAGDVGYAVATLMALNDPEHMAGLHLNRCGGAPPNPADPNAGLTPEEIRLRDEPRFGRDEGGYAVIQGTKPQTLGYGLNDSPVGLAAWIVEKYRKWCDCHGDPENVFTKDELLTTVMIYWVTETTTSAARYYYEGQHIPEPPYAPIRERVKVPTGCTVFPGEVGFTPRSWAEKYFNVQRFTFMPKGGHFAALEQPVLLTNEVRAFFRDFR